MSKSMSEAQASLFRWTTLNHSPITSEYASNTGGTCAMADGGTTLIAAAGSVCSGT